MANTNGKCGFVCVLDCLVVVVVVVDVVVQRMLSTKSIKDPHHFSQGGVRQDLAS